MTIPSHFFLTSKVNHLMLVVFYFVSIYLFLSKSCSSLYCPYILAQFDELPQKITQTNNFIKKDTNENKIIINENEVCYVWVTLIEKREKKKKENIKNLSTTSPFPTLHTTHTSNPSPTKRATNKFNPPHPTRVTNASQQRDAKKLHHTQVLQNAPHPSPTKIASNPYYHPSNVIINPHTLRVHCPRHAICTISQISSITQQIPNPHYHTLNVINPPHTLHAHCPRHVIYSIPNSLQIIQWRKIAPRKSASTHTINIIVLNDIESTPCTIEPSLYHPTQRITNRTLDARSLDAASLPFTSSTFYTSASHTLYTPSLSPTICARSSSIIDALNLFSTLNARPSTNPSRHTIYTQATCHAMTSPPYTINASASSNIIDEPRPPLTKSAHNPSLTINAQHSSPFKSDLYNIHASSLRYSQFNVTHSSSQHSSPPHSCSPRSSPSSSSPSSSSPSTPSSTTLIQASSSTIFIQALHVTIVIFLFIFNFIIYILFANNFTYVFNVFNDFYLFALHMRLVFDFTQTEMILKFKSALIKLKKFL